MASVRTQWSFGGKCCKGGIYTYNLKGRNRKKDGKIYTFPMHWDDIGVTMLTFS